MTFYPAFFKATTFSRSNFKWRKNGLAAASLFQGHHIFTIKLLKNEMLLCTLSNSLCSCVKVENLPIWVWLLDLGIMFLIPMHMDLLAGQKQSALVCIGTLVHPKDL